MIEEPSKGGDFLDLICTKKEELIRDLKVRNNLSSKDHEVVEFRILRGQNKLNSHITTLDFRRADLIRILLGGSPWEMILERGEVQDNWLISRLSSYKLSEWSVLICRKSS